MRSSKDANKGSTVSVLSPLTAGSSYVTGGVAALFQEDHSNPRITVSAGRRLRENRRGCFLHATQDPHSPGREDIFLVRPKWEWSRGNGRSVRVRTAQEQTIFIKNRCPAYDHVVQSFDVCKKRLPDFHAFARN